MRNFSILALCLLFAGSCSADPESAPVHRAKASKDLPDFEFAAQMARMEAITLEETLRMLSLSHEAGEPFDPAVWKEALSSIGWISSSLKLDDVITYGRAGKLLAGLCHLEGDVFLSVFGPSERYGLRECQRLGYLDGANSDAHLHGSVLMTALSMADAYLAKEDDPKASSCLKRLKEALKSVRDGKSGGER